MAHSTCQAASLCFRNGISAHAADQIRDIRQLPRKFIRCKLYQRLRSDIPGEQALFDATFEAHSCDDTGNSIAFGGDFCGRIERTECSILALAPALASPCSEVLDRPD